VTTPTRTRSPHRERALRYLRDARVTVTYSARERGAMRAERVFALISPAPGDRSGNSVLVRVRMAGGVWDCDEHPGANECAHRLAVQTVTGWADLEGRWDT